MPSNKFNYLVLICRWIIRVVHTGRVTCALLSALLIALYNPAHAEGFSYSGYLKSYALGQDSISIDSSDFNTANYNTGDYNTGDYNIDSNAQSQNALRLMGAYINPERGNFEVHYEVQPLYFSNEINSASGIGSTLSIGNNRYRYNDLDPVLSEHGDHMATLQNLDRFNYQLATETGDLTIGRQVISFGSARFINPTDIFLPFVLQTLNQEYRVGIDAIRYQVDLDGFSILDSGLIIGEDAKTENSAAFFRGKTSFEGNDLEVMTILLEQAWLVGGGIERALGDFGFWLETAYMNNNDKQSKDYWRHSVGSDFALVDNIIVMLEYHYNGAGSQDPADYIDILQQQPYERGGVYLLGQNYLIPAISWIATPLISMNASSFYNVDDQSAFLSLAGEISWSDNLYSDLGTQMSLGDNPELSSSGELNLASEFGSYPLSLYASLRYYF